MAPPPPPPFQKSTFVGLFFMRVAFGATREWPLTVLDRVSKQTSKPRVRSALTVYAVQRESTRAKRRPFGTKRHFTPNNYDDDDHDDRDEPACFDKSYHDRARTYGRSAGFLGGV